MADQSAIDAQALVKIGKDIHRLTVSIASLQTILAALVDPANPQRAFQQILDQDKHAQSLAPTKELDLAQLMIESMKKNPTPGKA